MTVNHDVLSSMLRVAAKYSEMAKTDWCCQRAHIPSPSCSIRGLATNNVEVAQLVERKVVALVVVGANPTLHPNKANIAQVVERFTCNEEVPSSTLGVGSKHRRCLCIFKL